MTSVIIGIDISKHKFDVAYMATNQKWQRGIFANNPKGFKALLQWLTDNKIDKCHAVMEATGRYGEDLANLLYISGHHVSIVNPTQIKYYGRSLLKRTKTDKIDSQIIAEFAQRHQLSLWKPLPSSLQSLKERVRCLNAFKEDATQTSNRLGEAKDSFVTQMLAERLAYIQKQMISLAEEINNLAQKQPSVSTMVGLLVSIPGIGQTTALNLLAELPDLSTFKCAKQLAAYAGLNPSICTSGSSIKGRGSLSKTGNRILRKTLFLPAMSLMSRASSIRSFIERLRAKGKKGKVIIVAVMRKLLHIIFGVLKKETPFQPLQYQNKL
jgi:transposase